MENNSLKQQQQNRFYGPWGVAHQCHVGIMISGDEFGGGGGGGDRDLMVAMVWLFMWEWWRWWRVCVGKGGGVRTIKGVAIVAADSSDPHPLSLGQVYPNFYKSLFLWHIWPLCFSWPKSLFFWGWWVGGFTSLVNLAQIKPFYKASLNRKIS